MVEEEKEGTYIGKVSHYFDKIGVAAVRLEGNLKVGDTIRIEGGGASAEQEVDSMEVDREAVTSAKKGDEVGMKVSGKVREGYRVYKL